MHTFLKGIVIGFSIAAPVGPIGLLCIRRSLNEGRLIGFVSGLGAATADAIYGTLAALGITAVTSVLVGHHGWLQLAGGLFLVLLGANTLRSKPPDESARGAARSSLFAAYASTFALTLTNPLTILSFVGIFAGVGLGATDGRRTASLLVLGVAAGSAAWWLILSSAASWLGERLKHGGLRIVNVLAGVALCGFGLWQLSGLVQSLR